MNPVDRPRTLLARHCLSAAIDEALLAMPAASEADQVELRAIVGIGLERKGLNAAALRHLDRVLSVAPNHARALAHRGIAYDRLFRQEEARADLQRAVGLDPSYALAWEELAYTCYTLDDPDGMGRALDELERLGAASGELFRLRGEHRLEAGDREGGIADLRRGCEHADPMSAYRLDEAGVTLTSGPELAMWGLDREKRRMPDEAIDAYQRAVQVGLDPSLDVRVVRWMTGLLVAQGRRDEALEAVVALTTRHPGRADAWLARGEIDEDPASFDEAHALSPTDAAVAWGRHLLTHGRKAEALEVCAAQVERDPDDCDAWALLGDIHHAFERADAAKEAWSKAEMLGSSEARRARVAAYGPERGMDHFEAALALLDAHDRDGAAAEFDRAADRFRTETRVPGDEAHRYLAKALYNSAFVRELRVADDILEPSFREAIELEPTYTEAMLSLGNLCLRTGREDEGLEWFERAGEIDPSAGQGWYYRARHYFQKCAYAQAVEDATKAFEAYVRRSQGRFAADAIMIRGEANEALGNLYDAKRDYDLAYEYGHPTGYAKGDHIRERIALDDPDSEEAQEMMDKIIDQVSEGEYPWAFCDVLEARVADSKRARAVVARLREGETPTDDELDELVAFLEGTH